tara:strand:+ start:8980 stop:9531 length:552 start_codon:yes stop_codon:yes gene_type:complete
MNNDLSGNYFYQLKGANSSGDYLTLKKARYIYNTHKSNVKINSTPNQRGQPYKKGNSHSRLLLYNKGYLLETADCSGSLYPYRNAEQLGSKRKKIIAKGTLSGTMTLSTDASSIDNYYKGKLIKCIRTDTHAGDSTTKTQTRNIKSYNGTTKVFTVTFNFKTPVPDEGDSYEIFLGDNGSLTF